MGHAPNPISSTATALPTVVKDVDFAFMRLSDAVKATPNLASRPVQKALTELQAANKRMVNAVQEAPGAVGKKVTTSFDKLATASGQLRIAARIFDSGRQTPTPRKQLPGSIWT